MKVLVWIAAGFVLALALVFTLDRRTPPAVSGPAFALQPDRDSARIEALERTVADLTAELRELELASVRTALAPRGVETQSRTVTVPLPASSDAPDPAWYLQQYVRSFEGGGEGSEYFRLAVDAYALVLVDAIGDRVLDVSGPAPMRMSLVAILGGARFRGDPRAIDPLVGALRTARASEAAIAAACVEALGKVGDAATALALERMVWSLEPRPLRAATLATIVTLSGPDANRALRRLFDGASDADRVLVVAALQTSDLDAALDVLALASRLEVDVRLAAAQATLRFRGAAIELFVEEWLARESEERVRAVLGAARETLRSLPRWGALQVVGAPNSTPGRDDARAWTYLRANMGRVWLQVGFEPRRAHEIRVHETYTAGAVVEIALIDEQGRAHIVFAGADPTRGSGVLSASFATTSYRVRAARIVLDTALVSDWCEIDAVQLVGPEGSQWAREASASATYGE